MASSWAKAFLCSVWSFDLTSLSIVSLAAFRSSLWLASFISKVFAYSFLTCSNWSLSAFKSLADVVGTAGEVVGTLAEKTFVTFVLISASAGTTTGGGLISFFTFGGGAVVAAGRPGPRLLPGIGEVFTGETGAGVGSFCTPRLPLPTGVSAFVGTTTGKGSSFFPFTPPGVRRSFDGAGVRFLLDGGSTGSGIFSSLPLDVLRIEDLGGGGGSGGDAPRFFPLAGVFVGNGDAMTRGLSSSSIESLSLPPVGISWSKLTCPFARTVVDDFRPGILGVDMGADPALGAFAFGGSVRDGRWESNKVPFGA